MGRIMDALVAYLSEKALPYYQTESPYHLFVPATGASGRLKCVVEAREDLEQVLFVAIIDLVIPHEKLLAVAEYIARVNATLAIGSFDLDFDEGLVAYRTSIEVVGVPLTACLIDPLPKYALAMADKYTPGIKEVMIADANPIDALESVERLSMESVPDLATELLD